MSATRKIDTEVDTEGDGPLTGEWSLTWTAPGAATDPTGIEALTVEWLPAGVPGTAAAALRANTASNRPAPPRLDGVDWWYRCTFTARPAAAGERLVLCLDGLATVADVWLNDQPLLRAENMFVAHAVDVTDRLVKDNQLVIRFVALDALLATRRPRPRWRAPMIEHQQLRWFRTTLLGRTPGWSPALPPVGPWRRVHLQRRAGPEVETKDVSATFQGADGIVTATLTMRGLAGRRLTDARLVVSDVSGQSWQAPFAIKDDTSAPDTGHLTGAARVGSAAPWWPHTHGEQPLYDVRAVLTVDGAEQTIDIGRVGFRTVALSTTDGTFSISINGVPIFCRGACWTPPDAATLTGSPDDYRRTIQAVRDAGMNMLRVCGPMVYESHLFHDLCDQHGILVWQDLMFANMDYPEDAGFVANVHTEVRQALGRWQGRPSLALICGDSEGEQQAAMWGAPASAWHRPLFREVLPALCGQLCPDVPYWPSSASGGAFPHQASAGSTSYYGVGAYLRPLDDARRSDLRFASECLAFANIPEDTALAAIVGGGAARVHTPAWKSGVPRDLGAGWDFDDVRDHYLGLLFGVDPVALRSRDPDRYLALGRITTGEVMESAFAEWRRGRSPCRGALIWFLRDLVPGAGWGVLDVNGRPKAAYHYLRRILRPVAVFFSDEGLNGVVVHAVNERATPWQGQLRLRLYQNRETQVGAADRKVTIPARGSLELSAAELLGGFWDTTYAYRFGPPGHDLVTVSLVSDSDPDTVESEAFHFPVGRPSTPEQDLGLEATIQPATDDAFTLQVSTRRFAQAIAVNLPGFTTDDNYFHVRPGDRKRVTLRRLAPSTAEPAGSIQAMNLGSATRVAKATGP